MPENENGEQPKEEGERVGEENPYTSPVEGGGSQPPQRASGTFADGMKAFGLFLAVLLLIVVVVFGLLVGCCSMSMSGMQGN